MKSTNDIAQLPDEKVDILILRGHNIYAVLNERVAVTNG
jgi:hypothetical protein